MDVLSDVLQTLKLKSSLYFRTQLYAPWGIQVPFERDVARFHVLVRGRCWLHLPETDQWVALNEGGIVIVPHGSAHSLSCEPETPARPLTEVLALTQSQGKHLVYGGEGQETNLVCGHFEFDSEIIHPLLSGLPTYLHVPAAGQFSFSWLDHLMAFIGDEVEHEHPGSNAIVDRLSEILFIQVIRAYTQHSTEQANCLLGLEDRFIAPALKLIHNQPGFAWRVEDLAAQVGLSRTAFSVRFDHLIGMPPGAYILHWRLQLARNALLNGDERIIQIAATVGYRSEAAFNKAFKRQFGISPARYRRKYAGRFKRR